MARNLNRLIASFLIALLAAPSPAFASWRLNLNPFRERRQDDIATVQVAVQSIAPFEDYIDSLQPHFPKSEKDALDEAVAQTRTQDTEEMTALRLALALRGPEITTNSEKKTTEEDGVVKTTATTTRTSQPGVLSDATAPDAVTRTLTATLPEGGVAIEPSIKYAAATALIQRLALLSSYVRDAAVRTHTKPYLVRMLVTVLPSAATRGYDAYTTVSFFSTEKDLEAEAVLNRVAASELARDSRLQHKQSPNDPAFKLNVDVLDDAANVRCDDRPIEAIPLLVTDTVSSSLHSDTLERIREVTAAAQAIASNARIGFGLRSQHDRIDKTLARNINGVMTVSRVAQNSIEVRLGAMFGNRDDALVPRTYDVTALLLFPLAKEQTDAEGNHDFISDEVVPCSVATYTAQTVFRNSQNGKVARPASVHKLIDTEVEGILERAGIDAKTAQGMKEIAPKLVNAARAGSYKDFRERITLDTTGTATDASLLWPQVAGIVGQHSFSRGLFQAPIREVQLFDTRTTGSLIDNSKEAVLTLDGGRNLRADRIVGQMTVTSGPKIIRLVAKDVTVQNDGRQATLKFDSITKFLNDSELAAVQLKPLIRYAAGARDWEHAAHTSLWEPQPGAEVTYVKTLKPKPDDPKEARFTLRTGAQTIVAKDGIGSIAVSLKHTKASDTFPMLFLVEGADITAVDGVVKPLGAEWGSAADGSGRVSLANLIPGKNVTIHVFSFKGEDRVDEEDVTLGVQPQSIVVTAAVK